MKKIIFLTISVCSVLAIACSSEDETGQQLEFETTDNVLEIDSTISNDSTDDYLALSEAEAETFEQYFSPKFIIELDSYLYSFNTLDSDTDFRENYELGISLFEKLYSAFYEPEAEYLNELKVEFENENGYWQPIDVLYDAFDELSGMLGPIMFTCVAECTEIDFIYDLNILADKAKTTKGKSDEAYMELEMSKFGRWGCYSCYGFPAWFSQTWDYGGSSLIGKGQLLYSIKLYIDFEKNHKGWDKELKPYRESYLSALTSERTFVGTMEEVLDEYNEILALDLFNNTEVDEIKKYMEALKTDEKYQFDCENNDCDEGG